MNPQLPQIEVNLDPIIYFFTHSLLIIGASAVIFIGMGVWIGWLTWARFKRRARAYQEECDLLRHEIASLKRRIVEELTEPAPLVLINEDATVLKADSGPELPGFQVPPRPSAVVPPVSAITAMAAAANGIVARMLPVTEPKKESLAAAVLGAKGTHAHEPIAPPDAIAGQPAIQSTAPVSLPTLPLSAPPVSAPALPTLPTLPDLADPLHFRHAVTPAPSASVSLNGQGLSRSPAPPDKPGRKTSTVSVAINAPDDPHTPPPLPPKLTRKTSGVIPVSSGSTPGDQSPAKTTGTVLLSARGRASTAPVAVVPPPAPVSAIALAFAPELAAGTALLDADLGLLLATRPNRWDDLTLVRGITPNVQQRLHDLGIHTFKQMAYWTASQVTSIALRLDLADRIERETWVQQAREMHYLKYGEKLA